MVYGSIYGASRYGVQEGQFDPTYAMPDGPDLMVQEAVDVDQRMFDLFVEHDFLECAVNHGLVAESTLVAIDESFVTDVWEKVKEFIIKIKNKVVSIAKAAAVKLNAFFIKDNGALVDKYKKQFDNADASKIEIKGWREYKEEYSNSMKSYDFAAEFDKACNFSVAHTGKDGGAATKKEYEKEHTADKMLSAILGKTTTTGSFRKDLEDKMFGPEKTVKANTIKRQIVDTLTDYQKDIETVNDCKKVAEDYLSECEKTADSMKKTASDFTPQDGVKGDNGVTYGDTHWKKDLLTLQADCAKYACSQYSIVISKSFSAILDLAKFEAKQARKAFIKIASGGAAKTESTLMEAEMDVSDYDVDSFFDQYSYDFEDLIA
jgi:hypothetical protein